MGRTSAGRQVAPKRGRQRGDDRAGDALEQKHRGAGLLPKLGGSEISFLWDGPKWLAMESAAKKDPKNLPRVLQLIWGKGSELPNVSSN